ncbi:glutathione-dependent formaldehyde-activating GFA [Mycena sanguinolenta]|nr:glutathione-dependent formaldehyde-activating GFA [Mycena sanguinolenta]
MPIPWPESEEVKIHNGGCHCKKIRYEFEHPDLYAMPVLLCNCSICAERGYLSVFTPEDKFKFTSGSEADLTKYEFASGTVGHRFCSTCGTSIGPTYAIKGMVVVNTRTVDGIDLERLTFQKYDGRTAH